MQKNENRPGYKETKAGWIPEDWDALHLKDIAEINPESLGSKTVHNYAFYYIDLSGVKSGNIELPENRTTFSEAPSRARIVIQKGDVLLATVRPNLKGFGYINFEANEYVCSTGFAVIRCSKDYNGHYIYQSLYSDQSSRYFYGCVVGTGYPALNSSDVDLMKIPFPPLPEQEAIAEILSCWDEGLKDLKKLIDSKKLRKKGLMQKLLIGEKRLPGFSKDWKKVQLRDVLQRTEPYKNLKAGKSYPLVSIRRRARGIFNRGIIPRENISYDKMAPIKLDDFLISKRQVSHGAYAVVSEQHVDCFVSSEYVILESKNTGLHMPFMEWLSKQRILWHKGYVSSNGVHIEKLILDPKHFLKHTITIPPTLEEQQAIAEVLETADEEIRLLEAERDALSDQKKGLMQKLLTGEKRLPAFQKSEDRESAEGDLNYVQ